MHANKTKKEEEKKSEDCARRILQKKEQTKPYCINSTDHYFQLHSKLIYDKTKKKKRKAENSQGETKRKQTDGVLKVVFFPQTNKDMNSVPMSTKKKRNMYTNGMILCISQTQKISRIHSRSTVMIIKVESRR